MSDETEQSEKTEDPTEHRISEARKRGDVPKSQELNSWVMLMAASLVLLIFAGPMASYLARELKLLLVNAHDVPFERGAGVSVAYSVGKILLSVLAFPFGLFMIAALAANLLQIGFLISLEPITPKLSKISPLAGLKRLFSSQSLVNFFKSLTKLLLISFVIFLVLWPQRDELEGMISKGPETLLPAVQWASLRMFGAVCSLFFFLAAADYAYTRMKWWNKLKMSLKELKEEHKSQQGDPEIKARIRQIRMQKSRQRMMAAVPDATLVITNPTHFAIALKYETGMGAPVCVAKGQDVLAFKIREIADLHKIPRVENRPLARALYDSVKIDEEIPEHHFKAVAEIIGYLTQAGKLKL